MTDRRGGARVLRESTKPLTEAYDLAMLDLDGVVYIGQHAVPSAAPAIDLARAAGMHVAFITNNASRTPVQVSDHLRRLGVDAEPGDVVTSAQAAARVLRETLPDGAGVLLLGGRGLEEAIGEQGLRAVGPEEGPQAVVTGYGPDVLWRDLMRAAVLIRDGLWWVASNTDLTIPTAYGLGPGHGVQVRMLSEFSGVTPVVAGKPNRPLLDETMRRVGGERPLMVGDRLDTDIEGAYNAGTDSLLVLTGVTGLAELAAARPEERPTYLATDLNGLKETHPEVGLDGDRRVLGGWRAWVADGELTVDGHGETEDWWRAAAAACWDHLDATGSPAALSTAQPPVRSSDESGR
ncbi:HAD-IIA family hydrolase [Nocardioides speluncae]|uniref:HAD-IIA family hydrolase n=1 Tax=Nocardioides speluncae TaxID=2670337 RepID=UPI001F0C10B5|nr:HAD-IIA family hydrolase [Nocardioides speluncae]